MHTLQDAEDAGGVRKAQEAEALGIPRHPRLSDPSDTTTKFGGTVPAQAVHPKSLLCSEPVGASTVPRRASERPLLLSAEGV